MKTTSAQLQPLIDELHEINREIANAARPLQWLDDLDAKAREILANQLRASLVRWEDITLKIHQLLEQDGTGAVPQC